MTTFYTDVFETGTPIGRVKITSNEIGVVAIQLLTDDEVTTASLSTVAKLAKDQILNYLANPSAELNFPTNPQGTVFQNKIWDDLRNIPVGAKVTYVEFASKHGTAPRPIANACRSNPLPIIVPCHRVVAKGEIMGYSSERSSKLVEVKRWLREHEEKTIK